MGFSSYQNGRAKCPLYMHIVRSDQSEIYGVQCRDVVNRPGVSGIVLKHQSLEALLAFKRLYCDDSHAHEACPYFKAWQRMNQSTATEQA